MGPHNPVSVPSGVSRSEIQVRSARETLFFVDLDKQLESGQIFFFGGNCCMDPPGAGGEGKTKKKLV